MPFRVDKQFPPLPQRNHRSRVVNVKRSSFAHDGPCTVVLAEVKDFHSGGARHLTGHASIAEVGAPEPTAAARTIVQQMKRGRVMRNIVGAAPGRAFRDQFAGLLRSAPTWISRLVKS